MNLSKETICICGGGSLGHVIAGTLSSRGVHVRLLSPRADKWENEILVKDCNGKIFRGSIEKKSANAEEVVPASNFILLCVPGYLIRETLKKIRPYLSAGAAVGSVVSSSGFFFEAKEILLSETLLFGFQRVPYIARVCEYGKSAELLGYKKELSLALENLENAHAREEFRKKIEEMFATPTRLLGTFWDAALTNSNPLLHPCRLFGLWHDWDGKSTYSRISKFYEDWDDFSSEILIEADKDFFALLKKLPVSPNAILPLLDYYECSNAQELTQKIKSIPAFIGIPAPMVAQGDGYVPDTGNRYFTEDIPFGMKIIKKLSLENKVETPMIDKILKWAECIPPPVPLKNELLFFQTHLSSAKEVA